MQLNHITLILVRSIKRIYSLRLDNKKATKSGFLDYWINELACISFASVG